MGTFFNAKWICFLHEELFYNQRSHTPDTMATINLTIDTTTNWADLAEEAAAFATPPPKEKGWTDVNGAPKKNKKTVSKTADPASAGVAKKLDFDGKKSTTTLSNNKFAAFADDDE